MRFTPAPHDHQIAAQTRTQFHIFLLLAASRRRVVPRVSPHATRHERDDRWMSITPQPQRFYDPSIGPGSPITVKLRRASGAGPELWFLEDRIAYRDRQFEAANLPDIVVPRDPTTFKSDLTSVPQLFTWLISRTGIHLPAALLHDALTPPFSARDADGNVLPDWIGPPDITQLQADRVFRDAMADLGTPLIRRWMIWSAVSLLTARAVDNGRALLGYFTLAGVAIVGWLATLDLFDQGSWVPWMKGSWLRELLQGGVMAVVIPLALAAVWPKGVRAAGAIAGVSIAVLLHVTIAVGIITAAYQLAEFRHRVWAPPSTRLKLLLTVLGVVAVVLTLVICMEY